MIKLNLYVFLLFLVALYITNIFLHSPKYEDIFICLITEVYCFNFHIQGLLSLVGLFIGLVSLFFFILFFNFYFTIIFLYFKKLFSLFSLFVNVYVFVSLCDFVCLVLLLPFGLGFYMFFFFFSFYSSKPCGWQGLGAPARRQA